MNFKFAGCWAGGVVLLAAACGSSKSTSGTSTGGSTGFYTPPGSTGAGSTGEGSTGEGSTAAGTTGSGSSRSSTGATGTSGSTGVGGTTGQGSSSGAVGTGSSTGTTSGGGLGGSGTGGTAGTTGAAPTARAAPQVVDLGGPVLTAAKVQLIAYTEDTMAPAVEAFITEFGATTEWAAQTSEYGVGPFTQLPTIFIPGTPPTSLDDNSGNVTPFEQTLINNITGTNPPWGTDDGTVMYIFLLPLGTNINSGGSCCTDFLGYHYEAPLASGNAAYGVICNCGALSGLTATQDVTTTVSHEMVETATDPYFNATPAYAQSDNDDAIWTVATGGEIADMCEYNTDSNYLPPGSTYTIQRSWSDAAADAGTNPCVPVPASGPYFNSYPVLADSITLNYGGPWLTQGVSLAVGQTATIDVVLASEAPTSGPWTITAWDLNDYLGQSPTTTTVSLDQTSGSNGDVVHLTIKVLAYDPNFAGAGFVLESTLNGQDNLYFGAVGQ